MKKSNNKAMRIDSPIMEIPAPSPTTSINIDLTKDLTEEIILHIFSKLDKRTLMKTAQVCVRWNRIVKDKTLWKVISLSPTTFELTNEGFLTLAKCRLYFTEKLHIQNTRVTFAMLRTMSIHCRNVKTLLFGKNCSIEEQRRKHHIIFPGGVRTLDLRLANGSFNFLCDLKCSNLENIINLGVGPLSFDKITLLLFLQKLPNLKYVDFTNCLDIVDDSVVHLSEKCPNLESLCLIGCGNILGKSFHDLIRNCKNLKTLLLRYLKINDDILAHNSWKDSVITEIDISACPRITYRGLFTFLVQMKELEYLNMSYCGEGGAVNDTVLYEMANSDSVNKLKMLDLRWSFKISSNALRSLLRRCVNLKYLGIYQSFQIKAENVADFLSYLPHLKILEFGSSDPQELSCSFLLRKLMSCTKSIEELSLINFKSSNVIHDHKFLLNFFQESSTLRRLNFCDCADNLVKLGRRAERELAFNLQLKGIKRRRIDITTKWECALPPPSNTIDRAILQ